MMTAVDIELVHAAQAGDISALGALLERQRASLYASALSILGDVAAAQDIVHDAFLIALRRVSDLRDPAAFSSWLHAIVRNACRMHLRSRRELPLDLASLERAAESSVEHVLERMALRDWVWGALDALPADLCATVMLRYFSRNPSYAEIAAVLGIPVGTVRSRLSQSRRLLAANLTATAVARHNDHAALLEHRWQWGLAAVDEITRHGKASIYVERCAPDVVVAASRTGHLERGIAARKADVVETIAIGVGVRLTGLVASAAVTIMEIDFENPPELPDLCPPKHTEVRFHPRQLTTRINLYYQHTPAGATGH